MKSQSTPFVALFAITLAVFLSTDNVAVTNAFAANPKEGGWKSRPLVPELSTAPEAKDSENGKKTEKKREKWELLRFISQSSKFVSLPKPPLPGLNRPVTVSPGDVLWSTGTTGLFSFAPLDDVVMGGVSSSTFQNKKGVWSGTVSDSNSGGFIGIRSTPFANALDMRNCRGIELTMRGCEDKVFKAVVRDSKDFNGICWTAAFGGVGNKMKGLGGMLGLGSNGSSERTVRIPFEELIPTIFARTVPGQELINKRSIEGFQVAFSKFLFDGELNKAFELGDFELELLEMKAY